MTPALAEEIQLALWQRYFARLKRLNGSKADRVTWRAKRRAYWREQREEAWKRQ